MRGEQFNKGRYIGWDYASPPLARGTGQCCGVGHAAAGITPACAGNRAAMWAAALGTEDHPRLRGEQAAWQMQPGDLVGSPPLARGTEGCGWIPASVCGITPACAGNSPPILIFSPPSRDHPPLARGTERYALYKSWRLGITPACAGNRCPPPARVMLVRDHPRLRGEQTRSPALKTTPLGSPPLARGTDRYMPSIIMRFRITPACAGNRLLPFICACSIWDHPRLRGEQPSALPQS